MSAPTPDENGIRYYGYRFARRRENPELCIEHVFSNARGESPHQCKNKRGFGPNGEFCKTHSPDAVEARRNAANARWRSKIERQNRPIETLNAYRQALEAISEGHNDPRSLAAETLKNNR